MEYHSALTNELRTVVIHSRSVYSQTRLADFGYIPECKSKNSRGLNGVSLPLARLLLIIATKLNGNNSQCCFIQFICQNNTEIAHGNDETSSWKSQQHFNLLRSEEREKDISVTNQRHRKGKGKKTFLLQTQDIGAHPIHSDLRRAPVAQ